MYTAHTLIVTLRNAKVNVCAAGIHFKNCILGNFRALSVQYNPFVSYLFLGILICSHATIVDRAVLNFPQLCHLGIHGVRYRVYIYTSISVLCICQEEAYYTHAYVYIYIYIYVYASINIYIYICIDI